MNNKKFYEDVIRKEIPSYTMSAWYQFLKRFKTDIGLVPVKVATQSEVLTQPAAFVEEHKAAMTMLSNNEALQRSIASAMNISAQALEEILTNPELVPAEKRAELFLKIMKAQDSRVKAIGTIKADNREQARFDRAMDNAVFD